MRVTLAPRAHQDLAAVAEWIGRDSPRAATKWLREIRSRCDGLKRFPKRYPLDHLTGLRRIVHGDYLLFYRIGASGIDVVRIVHGARDYPGLFDPQEDS